MIKKKYYQINQITVHKLMTNMDDKNQNVSPKLTRNMMISLSFYGVLYGELPTQQNMIKIFF